MHAWVCFAFIRSGPCVIKNFVWKINRFLESSLKINRDCGLYEFVWRPSGAQWIEIYTWVRWLLKISRLGSDTSFEIFTTWVLFLYLVEMPGVFFCLHWSSFIFHYELLENKTVLIDFPWKCSAKLWLFCCNFFKVLHFPGNLFSVPNHQAMKFEIYRFHYFSLSPKTK